MKLGNLLAVVLFASAIVCSQNVTQGVPQPVPTDARNMAALAKLDPAARIAEIQSALKQQGFDGWLFYDFRGSDILAPRILNTTRLGGSRRWFYFVPSTGEPVKVVHAIEPDQLD